MICRIGRGAWVVVVGGVGIVSEGVGMGCSAGLEGVVGLGIFLNT